LHARAELPQGLAGQAELLAQRPLTASAQPLTQLLASLALYRSFRFPLRLTLATRFGGTANLSADYEFFQAATLGGLSNLRGFGRTRFAGRQSAYNNTEVRLQLAHFRSYLLPATIGLLAFHDVGRVWVPGETSTTWHRGYGPGLWLAPTPQVVLTAMYGISTEGRLPLIRLGFFF
jgi:hemolysin activation/secretion protein